MLTRRQGATTQIQTPFLKLQICQGVQVELERLRLKIQCSSLALKVNGLVEMTGISIEALASAVAIISHHSQHPIVP